LSGAERFAERLLAKQRTAIRAGKAHRISDRHATATSWATVSTSPRALKGSRCPGRSACLNDPYRQARSRLNFEIRDLGEKQLKNTAEPVRVYSLEVGQPDLGLADFLRKGVAQPYGSVQH
jgi:hypothetical protein